MHGPEDEHPANRLEQLRELLLLLDRRVGGSGPAHRRPQKARDEGRQKTVDLRGQMPAVGVAQRKHVGHGASEAPAHRPEDPEIQNPASPVLASGAKAHGDPAERPGDHRSVFMPEVAPNAPADREGEHAEEDGGPSPRGDTARHRPAPRLSRRCASEQHSKTPQPFTQDASCRRKAKLDSQRFATKEKEKRNKGKVGKR